MCVKKSATAVAAVVAAGLALAAPASAFDEIRTDLQPGDLLRDAGVSVVVPEAGKFVWADATFVDGDETLGVLTQPDGTVLVSGLGRERTAVGALLDPSVPITDDTVENAPSVEPAGGVNSPGECDDSAYNLKWWTFSDGTRKHFKWKSTLNWHFRANSVPSNVSAANAQDAVHRAILNMTGSHNNCGMADEVGATQSYAGTTTAGTDINADGDACQANSDGKSVVAFGSIASDALAVNCTDGYWQRGDTYATATDTDTRINKAAYGWYGIEPTPCSNKYSIEAVMTHEWGHGWGLAHVSEIDHGNLTMSKRLNAACAESEKSLGRGDVLGMRALY